MVSNGYLDQLDSSTIFSDSSYYTNSFDMHAPARREAECVVIEHSQPPEVKAFVA
jgi:hypothetical protein